MIVNLTGKKAVITGGGRGLGRTIAEAYVAAGADVLIAARSREQVEGVARKLRGRARPGQNIVALAVDLGDDGAARELFSGEFAAPDILINNAGIQGPIGPLWTNTMEDWDALFRVCLFAPVALMQAAIPSMIERGWGRIINVSGGGAASPRPGFCAYAAAKAGLVRATETVAAELEGTGVTVNAIAPGPMNTAMTQGIRTLGAEIAGEKEVEAAARLAERNEPPGERASELCCFLAGDDAALVSGRLIAALWDPWPRFGELGTEIAASDLYTLRRIVPDDRNNSWG